MSTAAYRQGLDHFRRIGMLHEALLGDLDVPEMYPSDDPLQGDAVEQISQFVAKTGAVMFERRLEVRRSRAAPRRRTPGPAIVSEQARRRTSSRRRRGPAARSGGRQG